MRKFPASFALVLFAFIAMLRFASAQTTAPNQWTWVGGLSTGAADAVYGTVGTPAPGNIPGARDGASSWTDSSGNFWLFGGNNSSGVPEFAGSNGRYELNDLWKFNPSSKEWTWMGGSGFVATGAGACYVQGCGKPGVYGTLGRAAAGNFPGGRDGASSWTDSSGNLWLFGGEGMDASGTFGILNDLWEFNPSTNQWTWISGSSTFGSSCFTYDIDPGETNCAQTGVYGTLGTSATGNTPGSRLGASTWTDSKGNLWLFGGWGYDMNFDLQFIFNDLWEFDTTKNQWIWMGGSSTGAGSACFWNVNLWYQSCGKPGVYGTLGTPATGNNPGARDGANSWTDRNGNLWLFGGQGFDSNGQFSDLNDLWEFNPSSNQWTWVNGPNVVYGYYTQPTGVFGTLGTFASANTPPTRWGSVNWTDKLGNVWLYGGQQTGWYGDAIFSWLDDLWEYNPSTNQWAWMGGSNSNSPPVDGVYGTLGTPAPGNNPGDRFLASAWTDKSGNFWLFGGQLALGYVPIHSVYDNDLWVYQPANGPLPTVATPTISLPSGSYTSTQTITISDSTNGAAIYFTTDGSTPTTKSTLFSSNYPISVSSSETLQAIAVAPGCFNSAISSATYTLTSQVAAPTLNPPQGGYASPQTVTISDATPGATMYYTTDGTTPTTSSLVYSHPIGVAVTEIIQAYAVASGHPDSPPVRAVYAIELPNAAAPTFSVLNGTYAAPQTVTISDTTPGATIYYTTDGTHPTTNSLVYSGPITVSSTEPSGLWRSQAATTKASRSARPTPSIQIVRRHQPQPSASARGLIRALRLSRFTTP